MGPHVSIFYSIEQHIHENLLMTKIESTTLEINICNALGDEYINKCLLFLSSFNYQRLYINKKQRWRATSPGMSWGFN